MELPVACTSAVSDRGAETGYMSGLVVYVAVPVDTAGMYGTAAEATRGRERRRARQQELVQ
jgi:hypothetical protein